MRNLSDKEIARRTRLIKKYTKQGMTHVEIGEKLGVHAVNVCNFIKRYVPELRQYRVQKEVDPVKQAKWLMFLALRRKVAKNGQELKWSDVEFPDRCPVLGTKLDYITSRFDADETNVPSIDKTVPSKGYTKGNVSIISLRANRLKQDASIEEMRALLKYMKRACTR